MAKVKHSFRAISVSALPFWANRVVIVGLDIRKPKLAEYFGLEQKHLKGITSFLTDDSTDLHSLLLPTQASSNLQILPSGSVPPNPAELLARPSLDKSHHTTISRI